MKGILRLGVVVGILSLAPAAMAAGFIDIKWDDCSLGGLAAPLNKDYACNLTTGFNTMVTSFDPGVNLGPSNGIIADLGSIDVIATSLNATDLPQYWRFQPDAIGGCGNGPSRILFSADFLSGPLSCTDMWQGLGSTGGQLGGPEGPNPIGNTARIKWTTVVTPDQAISVTAGTQYYIEKVSLRRDITNCPGGCSDEVCLVFNTYSAYLLTGGNPTKWETDQGGQSPPYITWQQGASPVFNCPIPTPARTRSWGEIKSLYR